MSDPDKVLDRVRKLLRLAESSNVHEAANAAARAQVLIARHRLDVAALEGDETDGEIRDHADAPLDARRRLPRWRIALASTVARLGGCRVFIRHDGERRVLILVGRAEDAAAVRLLYGHLCAELERLTRRLGRGRGRHFSTAFRLGAVATVVERLEQAHRQAQAAARQEATLASGAAVVRLEHGLARLQALDAALDAWMRANLDLRRARPLRVRADADAYAQGRAAGHTVPLGHDQAALPSAG